MSLETFLATSKNTIQENSPSILAALAVGGVVTTGLLAHKAGVTYGRSIQAMMDNDEAPLTGEEKVKGYWRTVVPSVLTGAVAITCIIAGTAINNRRNAALAGLVTLGEVTFREYKDKVEKVVTKQKAEQVTRELAQEKLDEVPSKEIIFVDGDEVLFFDTLTSRIFKSTKNAIQAAEVEMGRQLLGDMYVSQNEWYDRIGLPRVAMGDDMGWNHDLPFEVTFHALEKDGKPVLALEYRFRPSSSFDRFG